MSKKMKHWVEAAGIRAVRTMAHYHINLPLYFFCTSGNPARDVKTESRPTRLVGNILMKMLTDAGVSVVNCTVDRAVSQEAYLEKTVEIANQSSLNLFISIHKLHVLLSPVPPYVRKFPHLFHYHRNILRSTKLLLLSCVSHRARSL